MSALRAACGLYLDPHSRAVVVDERHRWVKPDGAVRPEPRGRRIPRSRVGDDAILAALREAPSIRAAGQMLGLSRQAVQSRLVTMEAEGHLPVDIAAALAGRRRA